MKLFQPFTLNWWQLGLFKWGVLGCGLLLGAYFSDFVMSYSIIIGVATCACIVYITYLYFSEQK